MIVRNSLVLLQPYRLPSLFLPLTWGVAHRLLQLSGFQPENLYIRFHWPERPKLQARGQRPIGANFFLSQFFDTVHSCLM